MHTSTHDPDYSAHITSLAHQAGGWTESLAAKIVAALEAVLKAGKDLGPKLSPAYAQACEAAKGIPGFVAEHPLATAVFCTVLTLGILVLVAPSVLELVGFGQLGPRAGKASDLSLGFPGRFADALWGRELGGEVDGEVCGTGAEGVVVFVLPEAGYGVEVEGKEGGYGMG